MTGGRINWTAAELREAAGCGQATVYEVLRALRTIDFLNVSSSSSYSVNQEHALADPLRHLISALNPYVEVPVSRPSRGSRRA